MAPWPALSATSLDAPRSLPLALEFSPVEHEMTAFLTVAVQRGCYLAVGMRGSVSATEHVRALRLMKFNPNSCPRCLHFNLC